MLRWQKRVSPLRTSGKWSVRAPATPSERGTDRKGREREATGLTLLSVGRISHISISDGPREQSVRSCHAIPTPPSLSPSLLHSTLPNWRIQPSGSILLLPSLPHSNLCTKHPTHTCPDGLCLPVHCPSSQHDSLVRHRNELLVVTCDNC